MGDPDTLSNSSTGFLLPASVAALRGIDQSAHPSRNSSTSSLSSIPGTPSLPVRIGGRRKHNQQPDLARLVYRTSHGVETEFFLTEQVTKIGRRASNQIRLNCLQISKEHATIEKTPEGYIVRDLNSANGVYVRHHRVKEKKLLKDGDELQLGTVTLTFREKGALQTMIFDDATLTGTVANRAVLDQALLELVTIVSIDGTDDLEIHAQMNPINVEASGHTEKASPIEFPVADKADPESLKRDYELLRILYELSRMKLQQDVRTLLGSILDLILSVIAADCGVVLLIDSETGILTANTVRVRQGKLTETKEIPISSTILRVVLERKTCIVTSDAILDPRFTGSDSISKQHLRSVMCVPLIGSSNKVQGVIHLDSRQQIGAFKDKDLALVRAIANQTSIAIENTMLLKRVEREATMIGQLARFLPPPVVEKMVHSKDAIRKGGREIVGTVVFADIRGFTNMAEAQNPQETVDLLNDFFECLVEIVFARHGVLDKYIGDCLMAVFGTLEEEKDPVYNSVAAAIGFRDAIRQMNLERKEANQGPIGIGVGVNTGLLVSGFIGSSRRLEFTCIGDTVNVASRLCNAAGADQVLISEETLKKVENRVVAKFVSKQQFKGKTQGVNVYEVLELK